MRLPSTLNQLIDSFKDHELNFEPGTRFEYSNSGYALLTAIIETVSDMSYAEYIREQICHPLGMYRTGCDDGMTVVPDLASGYSFWEAPIHAAYADLSFPLGSYGLYSTTEDLLLWDQVLQTSKLLNKELVKQIFTPNLGSYACGWMVSEMLGRKCVHHFGDISGFSCDFLRFVDDQVTIIFLSNMNVTPVTHMTREIATLIFEKNESLPLPAVPIHFTNAERFAGNYVMENEQNKVLDISVKNGDLYVTVPKMYGTLYKFKLVPVLQEPAKTTFITEMVNEQLIFHHSLSGDLEYVKYIDCSGVKYMGLKG
jgi:CubicO group peptidase (beta-lactamase class C family)